MPESYGFIPSEPDLRDYCLGNVYKSIQLPPAFSVNHSKIKDQGIVGSCVPHSVTEVLEAYANDAETYSTNWIYGYRPQDYYQGCGMPIKEALKTVTQFGYLIYEDCPGNDEMPKVKEKIEANKIHLLNKAVQRTAISYARLKTVQDIKEAIFTTRKPVIVAIRVDEHGLRLDRNHVAIPPKASCSGHAVVCYGWTQEGLLIQNSWGKTWGQKGCFILPYDYPVTEAWLLTTDEQSEYVVLPKFYKLRCFLHSLGQFIKEILS